MKKIVMVASALVLSVVGNTYADQFTFDGITNNNSGDIAIGESQLFLDVTDAGSSQVLFTFTNVGPEASSITDIYFDDDEPFLMNFNSFVYNTSGVGFTVGASPGNLPGGNSISFSSNYDYDSDTPAQPMGVNPGEELGILFDLAQNVSFDGIIAALTSDPLGMWVGIHVQGFATGGSEGFVHDPGDPGDPIPEPATMLLFGTGLAGIAGMRRKLKK